VHRQRAPARKRERVFNLGNSYGYQHARMLRGISRSLCRRHAARRLEANSFRIEAIGEVRVAYPGLGMGISFTRISDEDRERLRELVRSISRPSAILGSRIATPPVPVMQLSTTSVTNPTAALQAIVKFFESRHLMGREEFLQILRKTRRQLSSLIPQFSSLVCSWCWYFACPALPGQNAASIGYDESLWRFT
jgi:hypothetical protein